MIHKIKHHFAFDVHLLRFIYFIPFICYIIVLLLMVMGYLNSTDKYLPYIFLQGIAVPISGLHMVFLYSYIYDDGAKETLLPYYKHNLMYDLMRYSMMHGFILILFILLLNWMNGIVFLSVIMLMHLLLLFIFYQLIGIALLTLFESLELSIAIYATYTLTEVITQGTFLPWPHIFIFEEPYLDIWLTLTFFFLILGIALSIAQLLRAFK